MSEIGGLPIVSNTRYGLFGPTNSFFFFFFSNRKHWTQMFSNWMCILWFSTNRICYLSDPKGIFNLQHLLWFFFFPPDDQMLFHFISKYEELPQFFWEIRIALEFSLTLEGFDSAREVPPSISLFHLTRILQDASLETGDPCLEEPCHTCTYLKSDILWTFLLLKCIIYFSQPCHWFNSFSPICSLRVSHPISRYSFSPCFHFSSLLV